MPINRRPPPSTPRPKPPFSSHKPRKKNQVYVYDSKPVGKVTNVVPPSNMPPPPPPPPKLEGGFISDAIKDARDMRAALDTAKSATSASISLPSIEDEIAAIEKMEKYSDIAEMMMGNTSDWFTGEE